MFPPIFYIFFAFPEYHTGATNIFIFYIFILKPVLRIRFIFSESGAADPVFKILIRIRVTQKRPDPTGSGSGYGSYLDMFLMLRKIHICLLHFLTKSKQKNYFDATVFNKILYNEKIWITGVFLWIKDPYPGDPKRPGPTGPGSGSATLI